MHSLAVLGVTGRMGQSLVRALRESPALRLSGALASPASGRLGQDAGEDGVRTGVSITADVGEALRGVAVALDFSSSARVADHAQACAAAGIPLLVGTTGYDAATRAVLTHAAARVPVLIAPNTSVGVSAMVQLVALAARTLGAGYEVEISEIHHRLKRDAPSGTALALGEAVAAARGQSLEAVAAYDRSGSVGPRLPGSIGFAALRAGDVVGEHTVMFAAAGERVEITHRATDRMTFARGALRAAEWLIGRPPGQYGMQNVLGL